MLITIPIATIFLVFLGHIVFFFEIIKTFLNLFKKKLSIIKFFRDFDSKKFYILLVLISIYIPVGAILVLKVKSYSDWRHAFFLHFSIASIAFLGFNYFYNINYKNFVKIKFILLLIIFLSFLKVFIEMITFHPFQQTYFNEYITFREKNFAKNNFELDYWRSGYLSATKKILELDSSKSVKIYLDQASSFKRIPFLKPVEAKKVRMVKDSNIADYIISNFRYRWKTRDFLNKNKIYSIYAFNSEIIAIYSNN